MKVFGLTGGIGMGKSTSDKLLRERGVPVVDTDIIARQIVEPGEPALEEIRKTFGSIVIDGNGLLRRDELAKIVFSNPVARKTLEEILHPRIRAIWEQQVDAWRKEGRSLAVVVIPLLFETDAHAQFDAVVCVACSVASQRQRLLERGWSLDQIQKRIQSQWPVEKKMELSNFVVWTEGSLDVHAMQLARIIPGI
ncbi:MAG: dephospho-CoA kinase [Pedosphaera sp.]|nr:dephospho-CoA kinase [Pedosphaera sp.]